MLVVLRVITTSDAGYTLFANHYETQTKPQNWHAPRIVCRRWFICIFNIENNGYGICSGQFVVFPFGILAALCSVQSASSDWLHLAAGTYSFPTFLLNLVLHSRYRHTDSAILSFFLMVS